MSDNIGMTFTHRGVPMVNDPGVVFVLSNVDLTRNDKAEMLDAISCGPRVSLILERVSWLSEGVSPRFRWERDIFHD
jgi:hypothetical protein